jgi:hypothetical protein
MRVAVTFLVMVGRGRLLCRGVFGWGKRRTRSSWGVTPPVTISWQSTGRQLCGDLRSTLAQ